MTTRLLIIGGGYSGAAAARAALAAGWDVASTTRGAPGAGQIGFAAAGAALAQTTHLLMTAPPGESGDPFLAAHGGALPGGLIWAGYLSTTGVYGDRAGGWVDEATPPAPGQPRSLRRLEAELAWRAAAAAGGFALDIFRVAGIYGPGRSAFDDLRAGHARRTQKPGHAFGRMVAHAAALLGVAPPPLRDYAEAAASMSEMARSFWAENRRVANAATKAALGIGWCYPTYREGLAAILRSGG